MRAGIEESIWSRRRALGGGSALLVLALAAWSPGLAGPWQFDDFATPLDDSASHSLAAWAGHLGVTLRPVTKLTYALEAEIGPAGPAPRRAFSILLQAVAAMLLGLLVGRLEPRVGPFGALLVAAIWLLHPVHAESVLAVSGRSALLAGLLLLAALLAIETRRSILAGVLFAFACLSRETALAGALPLVVLAASRRGETARARWAACAPFLVAGTIALLACVTTPRYLQLADYSFHGRPLWKSLYAQVGAVPVGLGLLLAPSGLSIDYGIALPAGAGDPRFLFGLFLYLLAAAGIVVLSRSSRAAAVGLALWLAALLPTQSVVPKLDALTNRPLSLALAGLIVAATPAVAALAGGQAPARRRRALATAAVVLIAALSLATAGRSALYRSELALWADAAGKSRVNARPHLQHALLLRQAGREAEARAALARAGAIDPFDARLASLSHVPRRRKEEP